MLRGRGRAKHKYTCKHVAVTVSLTPWQHVDVSRLYRSTGGRTEKKQTSEGSAHNRRWSCHRSSSFTKKQVGLVRRRRTMMEPSPLHWSGLSQLGKARQVESHRRTGTSTRQRQRQRTRTRARTASGGVCVRCCWTFVTSSPGLPCAGRSAPCSPACAITRRFKTV